MNELKMKLEKRKEEIENSNSLVFKEYEPSLGTFIEITKEERE